MRVEAYGKINIGLRVGGRRPDGFHDIDTYMARISLADILDIMIAEGEPFACRITGNEGYIHDGEEDLMARAARAFHRRLGIPFSVSIAIEKHIPVQGGLGGGSADAAAVLAALQGHFATSFDLAALGAEVSSDVPFFASGFPCAHVTGRGERVEESDGPFSYPVTIAVPDARTPTPQAFALLDSLPRDTSPLPPLGRDIPLKRDFPNDFELLGSSACPFAIAACSYVSLSGSGSVWYSISDIDPTLLFDFRGNCVTYKLRIV